MSEEEAEIIIENVPEEGREEGRITKEKQLTRKVLRDPEAALHPTPKSDLSREERRKLKKERGKLQRKEERELNKDVDVIHRLKNAKPPTSTPTEKDMTVQEMKNRLRNLIEMKRNARMRLQPDQRGPKQSEKEKMAKEIKKVGLAEFLKSKGLGDNPAVMKVIQDAMQSGDINNPDKMNQLLVRALSTQQQ